MIAPDSASELRAERRFDLVAAILIGSIALMAAILAVIQIDAGQTSSRAQMRAARLAADVTTRLSVSGAAGDAALSDQQIALLLGMQSAGLGLAAAQAGDADGLAVAAAEQQAYQALRQALTETAASGGAAPLDPYTAGLLTASTADLRAEVAEQNRQVDLANQTGDREQRAVFGLSLLALAGVLTGLAAVLRDSRAGWTMLAMAGLGVAGTVALAASALFL
jgi:hypothetical protein